MKWFFVVVIFITLNAQAELSSSMKEKFGDWDTSFFDGTWFSKHPVPSQIPAFTAPGLGIYSEASSPYNGATNDSGWTTDNSNPKSVVYRNNDFFPKGFPGPISNSVTANYGADKKVESWTTVERKASTFDSLNQTTFQHVNAVKGSVTDCTIASKSPDSRFCTTITKELCQSAMEYTGTETVEDFQNKYKKCIDLETWMSKYPGLSDRVQDAHTAALNTLDKTMGKIQMPSNGTLSNKHNGNRALASGVQDLIGSCLKNSNNIYYSNWLAKKRGLDVSQKTSGTTGKK